MQRTKIDIDGRLRLRRRRRGWRQAGGSRCGWNLHFSVELNEKERTVVEMNDPLSFIGKLPPVFKVSMHV